MKYKVVYGTDIFECSYTTFIGVTVNGYVKYKTVFGIFRKRLTEKIMLSILNEYPLDATPITITVLMESLKESGRANKEYEI